MCGASNPLQSSEDSPDAAAGTLAGTVFATLRSEMDDLFSSLGPPHARDLPSGTPGDIRRVFLGWDRPILETATAWLLSRHNVDGVADLSAVVAVVPGRRAARLLEAALVNEAERTGLPLFPPRIVTPARVPEEVLPRGLAIATRTSCVLAWMDAIGSAPTHETTAIFGSTPAPTRDAPWRDRHAAASTLLALHEEIGGLGLDETQIVERMKAAAILHAAARGDADRWLAIARIARSAKDTLQRSGAIDRYELARGLPDDRSAEADAGTVPTVVMVGVPELPGYISSFLRRQVPGVTALIAAPPGFAGRFDELGCVVPREWRTHRFNLPDDSIVYSGSPRDQAAAVLDALAGLGDSLAVDEVVVAAPSPDVAALLARLGGRDAIPLFRDAAGRSAASATTARLLRTLADVLESRSFSALAALIRHPDVERRLRTQRDESERDSAENWLVELDEYAREHLPTAIPQLLEATNPAPPASVRAALDSLRRLIGAFLSTDTLPLSHWTAALRSLFQQLQCSPLASSPEDPTNDEAMDILSGVIADIESAPATLLNSLPAKASDAVTFVLSAMHEHTLTPAADPGAIDLVGWLELPFDPARAVIIAGMNEGQVPAVRSGSPLLPNGLRATLGFPTSESEFARDLFLLAQLRASRRHLTLIAGRRSTDGDPLRPSRLLFACDPAQIPARVLESLGHARHRATKEISSRTTPERPPLRSPVATRSAFDPMPRVPFIAPDSMRVTGFRAFLRSPYGFFLEHVLNLKECEEVSPELDGRSFGVLMHSALHDFALDPVADSLSVAEIDSTLARMLESRVARAFGPRASPAILVQAEHVRLRLSLFAHQQARRRAEGWRILRSEWAPTRPAIFSYNGHAIQLRGRIDRVDIHDRTGAIAILDYKTGSGATTVDADHRDGRGVWRNLQLPLYRYLAAELSASHGMAADSLTLGYVQLGHDSERIGFELVNWTPQDLAGADEAAADVVRRVQAGDFFHLGDSPPESDVLAAIAGREGGSLPPDVDESTADSGGPHEDEPS